MLDENSQFILYQLLCGSVYLMLGRNGMTKRSLILTEGSSSPLRLCTIRFYVSNDKCNPCTLKDIRTLRSPKGRNICSLFYMTNVLCRFPPLFQCACERATRVTTVNTIREPAVNDKQYWSVKIMFNSCKSSVALCSFIYIYCLSSSY